MAFTAYHGTYTAIAADIRSQGLTERPVYLTLDTEIAEQYASERATEHNSKACIVTLSLPDSWPIIPDPNTDDDRDAWVSQSPIPAQFVSDVEEINAWS